MNLFKIQNKFDDGTSGINKIKKNIYEKISKSLFFIQKDLFNENLK